MGSKIQIWLGQLETSLPELQPGTNWNGILYTFLLTFLLWVVLRLLRVGKRYLNAFLDRNLHKVKKPVAYKNFTFIHAHTIEKTVRGIVHFLLALLYAIIIYAYFSILFSFFEATKDLAKFLSELLIGIVQSLWMGFVSYVPNLFSILVILAVAYYVFKLLKTVFNAIANGTLVFQGFYREWALPTFSLIRFFGALFILVLIFPLLPGSDSEAFKGVSVFLGLLLSLGSSSAVANVVAGIVLIYTRAFQVGDRIETNEIVGEVVNKALLVTQIRTLKNELATLPNSVVLGSLIKNYSREEGIILHTTVTIGYDAPWRQVHALLLDAAGKTQDILEDPKPFILQSGLDDFFVRYELNASTRRADRMMQIYSELHQNIQDSFNKAGVEILSPHYRSLRDGNASTVVSDT